MIIKRNSVNFHNVLSTSAVCKKSEWHFIARELRNAVIRNGLYATGPVIYQVNPAANGEDEAGYTFYLPVNTTLEMPENDKYKFHEIWGFADGLSFRHSDLEEDLEASYEMIRDAAQENGLELQEPFYNIYLEVYGGGIIDIYAPIVKED
jgi:effector-binding domain-containing protein